jgi:hypothetical protein
VSYDDQPLHRVASHKIVVLVDGVLAIRHGIGSVLAIRHGIGSVTI